MVWSKMEDGSTDSYAIGSHGGTPCTFYEASVVSVGEVGTVCCSDCWATGIFFKAG